MTSNTKEEVGDYPEIVNMCRLCLKENAGTVNIFDDEQSLVMRIMTCTAVEVQAVDNLPKLICKDCRLQLERSYYFRKRSQNSVNKLKKHLRLLNSGRNSNIFDKNTENDDDDLEFEGLSNCLHEIEEKEIEEKKNEIMKLVQESVGQKEQECYELKAKLEREYSRRIIKLQKKHQEVIRQLKKKHEREVASRIKRMKKNIRIEETNHILNEIEDFIKYKKFGDQKWNITSKDVSHVEPGTSLLTKTSKKSPFSLQMMSSESIESSVETPQKSFKAVEYFEIESRPPEKLLKVYNGENEENEEEYLNSSEYLDVGDKNYELNTSESKNDLKNTSNIEITTTLETNIEYDRQNDDQGNEIEPILYNLRLDDFTSRISDSSTNANLKIERFNNDDEDDLSLIEDENLLVDENTSESINSQHILEPTVEETLINQEDLSFDEDSKSKIEKANDKITHLKVVSSDGKIITVELQTNANSNNTQKPDALTNSSKDDTIKIFRCNVCPRTFSRKFLLARHQNLHKKKRNYSCHICQKCYACKSSLERHIRVHTGEKPFTCKECGRNFIQKEIMKRHELTHTGQRPYECPHCDKKFVQKTLLNQHIDRVHTANSVMKMHQCHLCSKSFKHTSGLSRHLLAHTGISYECKECGKFLSDKSALKRHITTIHQISSYNK